MSNTLINPDGPVMPGAGVFKYTHDFKKAQLITDVEIIMFGTFTESKREPNPGNNYVPGEFYSLNSIGMPNQSLEKELDELRRIAEILHARGQKLGVSVASVDNPETYASLTRMAINAGADFIEENCGCPNVVHGGNSRIASFDLKTMEQICSDTKTMGDNVIISLKVSPYSDPLQLKETAMLINDYPHIKAVTAINTFPFAFDFNDDYSKAIEPNNGFAGLSGPAILPIALGQVRQWRQHLREETLIFGCGGVTTAKDVKKMIEAGANKVQIVSEYLRRDTPSFFSQLWADLVSL